MDKLTIRDLLDAKGKRQLLMTTALDYFTAKVADEAGFDLISTSRRDFEVMQETVRVVRSGAPRVLISAVLPLLMPSISEEECMRGSVMALRLGPT